MNEKLSQAMTLADTAALRRARYRAAAEATTSEADALAAQAETKRAEAAFLVGEAEKQDQAYASAIDLMVEHGIDRADAEGTVAGRVRMLVKSNIDIPLPTQDTARTRTRSSPRRRTKDVDSAEETASSSEGTSSETGASEDGEGAGGNAAETDASKVGNETGRNESVRSFRLPQATPETDRHEGE